MPFCSHSIVFLTTSVNNYKSNVLAHKRAIIWCSFLLSPFLNCPKTATCQLMLLFRLSGFDTAGQFCNARPNFHPSLFNGNGLKSFCDLPRATKVSPCGLNALWSSRDQFALYRLGPSSAEHSNKEPIGIHGSIVHRYRRESNSRFPAHDAADDAEPPNSAEKAAHSVTLDVLKDVLGWNTMFTKQLFANLEINRESSDGRFRRRRPDNSLQSDKQIDHGYFQEVLEELYKRWTPEKLTELEREIRLQHNNNPEVQLFTHLLKMLDRYENDAKLSNAPP
eukprot:284815242_6